MIKPDALTLVTKSAELFVAAFIGTLNTSAACAARVHFSPRPRAANAASHFAPAKHAMADFVELVGLVAARCEAVRDSLAQQTG